MIRIQLITHIPYSLFSRVENLYPNNHRRRYGRLSRGDAIAERKRASRKVFEDPLGRRIAQH